MCSLQLPNPAFKQLLPAHSIVTMTRSLLSIVTVALLASGALGQGYGGYSPPGVYGLPPPAIPPAPLFAPGPGPFPFMGTGAGIESDGEGVPFVFPTLAPGPAGGYGGYDCTCTAQYAPVCSTGGIQYSSPCHASCAGVFQFTVGPCASAMAGSGAPLARRYLREMDGIPMAGPAPAPAPFFG